MLVHCVLVPLSGLVICRLKRTVKAPTRAALLKCRGI